MKKSRLLLWIFFAVIFFIFLSFSSLISFVTDIWWFGEVGYTGLFFKPLIVKVAIVLTTSLIAAFFLITNFLIATASQTSWVAFIPKELAGASLTINDNLVKKIAIAASVVISLFLGLITASYWLDILKFFSSSSFGVIDPIFKKDVAYYVFSLPLFQLIQTLLQILIFISIIGTLVIYFLRGSVNFGSMLPKSNIFKGKFAKIFQIDKKTRIHLSLLIFLLLVLISYGKYLALFNLLTTTSGPIFGAAYTDATFAIPITKISSVLTLLIAGVVLFWGISAKLKPLVIMLIFYFLFNFSSAVIPSVFQKLIVAPNELKIETPFIKNNIMFTRKAYDLEKIEKREIVADKPLTASDIAANSLTIKNVRLWDRDPLLSTFSQIQEIRTYYEFVSVDNDRYMIDNEIRQIMLSPREIATDSLPNRNWINEKLTFTHGYGVAAGPVNQVTAEGLPVLFVKDLPPKSEKKELNILRPEIFYGELTNDYVITNTKSKEFDYPKGEENVYSTYKGQGGVAIDSFLKKITYAIRFNSLKMLLSDDITRESRILYFRNVQARVNKIAPFLMFDRDHYSVIADGKIYWIFDAYTRSNLYPYSQPLSINDEQVNYVRNSVKVVVNAYDGKVAFYLADTKDPIIRAYAKIFPNTFKSLDQMPKSLRTHLRYPEDIFTLQTAIYTVYHMDNPQIFYNKEDQWEVPTLENQDSTAPNAPMGPRHIIMKLPDEKKEEFILMLPFTPNKKDNLAAWMVARNDGENYGKLMIYQFPKQKLVYGPKQVISRINQDAEVSRQISLWDQRGSQVIQGPLLVIPIEKSLIYIRPLYLKADTGKIPELKRVIVAYENKIAMEETLEKALARILGTAQTTETTTAATQPTPQTEPFSPDILKKASDLYDEAIKAQKDGDWTRYGEAIRKLGELLKK